MKRSAPLLCIFIVLALLCPLFTSCTKKPMPEGMLRLAEDGKTDYRVVISADADEDTVKIAEEFVGYFEKLTGALPEIVRDNTPATEQEIVIGKTSRAIDARAPYDALGEEGLYYAAEGTSLLITGGAVRGVAYAMYDFLEEICGVRYWSSEYETVPNTPTLDIKSDLENQETPVFWYRCMNEAGSADPKWMVKMRLNSRQSLGSERYRKNPFVGGGHGYADWFVHTIGKLAEMNNDYPDRNSFTNLQPCLSDEDTYQTVLKNVRKWLEEYPDATIVSISQNDGTSVDAMCTCENCSKLYFQYGETQSAKWIWFVSKIANELRDEYPNVYFDTLAYNFTLAAPQNIEIPDNVIVRLAPAHTCINHDYKSCMYIGNHNNAKMNSVNFGVAMQGWAKLADHRFIWDYDALFYNYLAPFCNFDYIHNNIRNYAEDGIEGVFMQGDSTGSNSFAELRAYLVAKCLWDPYMIDAEYDALISEFLDGYYGKGSSEVLMQYIDFINLKLDEKHFTLYAYMITDELIPFATTTDEKGVVHLDRSDMIDPMYAYFEEAAQYAVSEEEQHHLRKALIQVKYYEAMASYWIVYEGEQYEIDTERRAEVNRSLYDDVIACGVQQLSEGQVVTSTPNLNNSPLYWDR